MENRKQLRRDWSFIDAHVKTITDSDSETFDSLIKFFNKPIQNRLDRNLYMTRAIIYWMFYVEHKNKWPKKAVLNTPMTLMKLVSDRRMDRSKAFKQLCDEANIPCECVTGVAKQGNFKPGEKDIKKFRSIWNKVYLEGNWWPVFPSRIMQPLSGGTHCISPGLTEFWFLTDPELFIYQCYPDNEDDQMLPRSKQVKTVRKFTKLPFLNFLFFENELMLTSEESSVLDADDGICLVTFKANSARAKSLSFQATLILPVTKEQRTKFDANRLIFSSRRKGKFLFEVRCPVLGEYLLQIRGGHVDEKENTYVTAKIECLETVKGIQELPVDAGKVGWGFGPTAENAGLSKPSIKDPKLISNGVGENYEAVKLRFALNMKLAESRVYEGNLYSLGKRKEDLRNFVKTQRTEQDFTVEVKVRQSGEYALVVSCEEVAKDGKKLEKKAVCYFLITTLESPDEVAEIYEDSSDGLSDLDDENLELEREISNLEVKYNELLKKRTFQCKN